MLVLLPTILMASVMDKVSEMRYQNFDEFGQFLIDLEKQRMIDKQSSAPMALSVVAIVLSICSILCHLGF